MRSGKVRLLPTEPFGVGALRGLERANLNPFWGLVLNVSFAFCHGHCGMTAYAKSKSAALDPADSRVIQSAGLGSYAGPPPMLADSLRTLALGKAAWFRPLTFQFSRRS